MNKDYSNNRTFIWIIIIVALIIYGTSRDVSFSFFSAPKLQETLSFNKDELDLIEVSLHSFDVIIEEHNDNTVRVEVYSNQKKANIPSVKHEGTALKIVEKNMDSIGFNIRFESNRIKIYIPKGEVLQYEIITSSGDIKSIDIESLTFMASSTSGDIELIRNLGSAIELQATSGDIDVDGSTLICVAKTTSGDITLKVNERSNEIKATSTSGEIEFNITQASNIDVKSTSGEVSGRAGTDSLVAQTTSGEIDVELTNMPVNGIQVNAVSGEITLELPKNNGFKLDYTTTSGYVRNDFTGLKDKGSGVDIYEGGSVIIQTSTTSGDINIED